MLWRETDLNQSSQTFKNDASTHFFISLMPNTIDSHMCLNMHNHQFSPFPVHHLELLLNGKELREDCLKDLILYFSEERKS